MDDVKHCPSDSPTFKDKDAGKTEQWAEVSDPPLRVDKHGLPLVPQPSSHPSDPYNFPQWLKIAILIQVSIMGLLMSFTQAIINPAYVSLAKSFHISVVVATYQTAVQVGCLGLGGFLFVPLANSVGRRPVYLVSSLVVAATGLASGKAKTWGTLLFIRALNGIFSSPFPTLGAGAVADTFFLHERGRAMGVFTVFLTNSAHLAPIPGGFLAQFVGWQWCYYFSGIVSIVMFFVMLFCLPETIPLTPAQLEQKDHSRPVLRRMRLWTPSSEMRALTVNTFLRPWKMFFYPSVLFSAIYYGYAFGISSILPAVTVAALYNELYGFNNAQNGLALGLSLLIGACLGEILGGPVVDFVKRRARSKNARGEAAPEAQLLALWPGALLVPAGIMIYGFCIQFKTPFMGPTVGLATMSFGLQIASTVIYSYTADCYKPQTAEIAQVLNLTRQGFGCTLGFWALRLGDRIGFQWFGVFLALVSFLLVAPMAWLTRNGVRVRDKLGKPDLDG